MLRHWKIVIVSRKSGGCRYGVYYRRHGWRTARERTGGCASAKELGILVCGGDQPSSMSASACNWRSSIEALTEFVDSLIIVPTRN